MVLQLLTAQFAEMKLPSDTFSLYDPPTIDEVRELRAAHLQANSFQLPLIRALTLALMTKRKLATMPQDEKDKNEGYDRSSGKWNFTAMLRMVFERWRNFNPRGRVGTLRKRWRKLRC